MTNVTKSYWQERPVFVTGATGLLGGWLVHALVQQGARVIALIRDSVPSSLIEQEHLLDRVTVVRGSLEEFSQIHRALSEYSVDTVFHLAAQPLVGVAKVNPMATLETNIRGTWHVLEAARLSKVRGIVVASSDKAYGASDHLPYCETDPLRGNYPYDVSKSCADLIATMYAASFGLPVAVVRCANLFGGGDLNFSRLIPDLIRATLAGERFVIRSDGKFVRDFLYVKDAVAGYLLVAEHLGQSASLAGEAFNLSMELRITVLEVVREALRLLGRLDLEPIVQNKASSEIREQYMDSGKARQVLGWSPRYTLETGLLETIRWYASYLGRELPDSGNVQQPERAAAGAFRVWAS